MRRNTKHIITGVTAVIESADAVTSWDIWVDVNELPETLRQIRKITGEEHYSPKVYPPKKEDNIADKEVCIVLE